MKITLVVLSILTILGGVYVGYKFYLDAQMKTVSVYFGQSQIETLHHLEKDENKYQDWRSTVFIEEPTKVIINDPEGSLEVKKTRFVVYYFEGGILTAFDVCLNDQYEDEQTTRKMYADITQELKKRKWKITTDPGLDGFLKDSKYHKFGITWIRGYESIYVEVKRGMQTFEQNNEYIINLNYWNHDLKHKLKKVYRALDWYFDKPLGSLPEKLTTFEMVKARLKSLESETFIKDPFGTVVVEKHKDPKIPSEYSIRMEDGYFPLRPFVDLKLEDWVGKNAEAQGALAPPDYDLLSFKFEFRHPVNRGGCKIATPREIAEIAQVQARKPLIAETLFGGLEINVPKVMREIGRMKAKGYQAVYISTATKQTVDFYFIPGTKLSLDQPFETSAASGFDGPLRFVSGAFVSYGNMVAADHLTCITGGAK